MKVNVHVLNMITRSIKCFQTKGNIYKNKFVINYKNLARNKQTIYKNIEYIIFNKEHSAKHFLNEYILQKFNTPNSLMGWFDNTIVRSNLQNK